MAEEVFNELRGLFLRIETVSDEEVIAKLKAAEPLILNGSLNLQQSIKVVSGSTMLHAAAWHCRYEVMEFLVQHKFDANLRNKKQNTALHLLMERHAEPHAHDCIRLLLEHGADPTLLNDSQLSPLQIAQQHNFDPMTIEQLQTHLQNILSSSATAPLGEDPQEAAEQCFRKLRLSFLAAVEVKSESSMIDTLQTAVPFIESGHLSLNRPIKVNSGSTLLHTCAWFLKTQLADWLIDHGVRCTHLN